MEGLNRREFVIGASAVCAGMCLTCGTAEAQSRPSPPKFTGTLAVGNIKDYPKDSLSDKFKAKGCFIGHENGEIYALSTLCTHKNVALDLKPDKSGFHCKAHGSDFTEFGTVDKGPAKRSLQRYAIKADDKGELTVNFDKTFAESDWEEPEAFVKAS